MSDGRDAILAVINALEEIRSEWKSSDSHMIHLLSNGMQSSQGSFERIMKSERGAIYRLISDLRRTLIPSASQYLDISLRDQIRQLVNDLDPNVDGPDRYGETAERWRHTWDALFYDSRYEDLIPLLHQNATNAVQTQRVNANRRAGEDRISPHEITPYFSDPSVIRSACYSIANMLPMIRDDWQEGDAIESEWRMKGWSTIGDHFLSTKKSSRYEVDRLLNKIIHDAGVLVLPHLDPSLRNRLIQFEQDARPYEYTDVHGDRGERWHLCWNELVLDSEITFLGTAIRAFGDSNILSSTSSDAKPDDAIVKHSLDRSNLTPNRRDRKPSGYTAKELREEALEEGLKCSETTFRKIRKESGVVGPSGPAGQHFRYSDRDIRNLADAAKSGSFRDGSRISLAWRQLIGDIESDSARN